MRRLFGCPDIVSLTEKFLMARHFYRIFTENNPVMEDSKTFGIPEAKGLKGWVCGQSSDWAIGWTCHTNRENKNKNKFNTTGYSNHRSYIRIFGYSAQHYFQVFCYYYFFEFCYRGNGFEFKCFSIDFMLFRSWPTFSLTIFWRICYQTKEETAF